MLTPLMAGLLFTSIVSGRLISKFGRYRPFPIAGTAVMTVGMVLLSRLHISSTSAYTSLSMLVLGLGLGMVMQVLVLAVQNAVDYRNMGVATSGSILFRQVGGSIGISLFGAIFANRLHTELAAQLASGNIKVVDLTETLSPEFPHISLPPEMGQAWPFRIEEVSRYDDRGPAWYWNNFSCGEQESGRLVNVGKQTQLHPAPRLTAFSSVGTRSECADA